MIYDRISNVMTILHDITPIAIRIYANILSQIGG